MIRVAHAGVGGWGKNVVRVIGELTDLAWVVDTDEGRQAEYAARYPQATVTASFADALADDTVDAVAIATPVPTHYALAKQALEAGKHVFVEKPPAMKGGEIDYDQLIDESVLVVDLRNATGATGRRSDKVWKL